MLLQRKNPQSVETFPIMPRNAFKAPKTKRSPAKQETELYASSSKKRRTKDDFYTFCTIVLSYTQYESLKREELRQQNNISPVGSGGSAADGYSSDSTASLSSGSLQECLQDSLQEGLPVDRVQQPTQDTTPTASSSSNQLNERVTTSPQAPKPHQFLKQQQQQTPKQHLLQPTPKQQPLLQQTQKQQPLLQQTTKQQQQQQQQLTLKHQQQTVKPSQPPQQPLQQSKPPQQPNFKQSPLSKNQLSVFDVKHKQPKQQQSPPKQSLSQLPPKQSPSQSPPHSPPKQSPPHSPPKQSPPQLPPKQSPPQLPPKQSPPQLPPKQSHPQPKQSLPQPPKQSLPQPPKQSQQTSPKHQIKQERSVSAPSTPLPMTPTSTSMTQMQHPNTTNRVESKISPKIIKLEPSTYSPREQNSHQEQLPEERKPNRFELLQRPKQEENHLSSGGKQKIHIKKEVVEDEEIMKDKENEISKLSSPERRVNAVRKANLRYSKLEMNSHDNGESNTDSCNDSIHSNCSSSPDVNETDEESWDLITCHCLKPYAGRPMIECSECSTWIHLSCAKIRKSNIPETFVCQQCREAKFTTRKSNRIRTESKRISI